MNPFEAHRELVTRILTWLDLDPIAGSMAQFRKTISRKNSTRRHDRFTDIEIAFAPPFTSGISGHGVTLEDKRAQVDLKRLKMRKGADEN